MVGAFCEAHLPGLQSTLSASHLRPSPGPPRTPGTRVSSPGGDGGGARGWGRGLEGGAEMREARLGRGSGPGSLVPTGRGGPPLAAGAAEPSGPRERPAEGAWSLPSLAESRPSPQREGRDGGVPALVAPGARAGGRLQDQKSACTRRDSKEPREDELCIQQGTWHRLCQSKHTDHRHQEAVGWEALSSAPTPPTPSHSSSAFQSDPSSKSMARAQVLGLKGEGDSLWTSAK